MTGFSWNHYVKTSYHSAEHGILFLHPFIRSRYSIIPYIRVSDVFLINLTIDLHSVIKAWPISHISNNLIMTCFPCSHSYDYDPTFHTSNHAITIYFSQSSHHDKFTYIQSPYHDGSSHHIMTDSSYNQSSHRDRHLTTSYLITSSYIHNLYMTGCKDH